jgi:hypothetical protein
VAEDDETSPDVFVYDHTRGETRAVDLGYGVSGTTIENVRLSADGRTLRIVTDKTLAADDEARVWNLRAGDDRAEGRGGGGGGDEILGDAARHHRGRRARRVRQPRRQRRDGGEPPHDPRRGGERRLLEFRGSSGRLAGASRRRS